MTRHYIAGPMTGLPELNHAAFFAMADRIQQSGGIALHSATLPAGLTEAQYMDICFAMIRASDVIVLLPGWENSVGALAEYHYARKLGLQIRKGIQHEIPAH